MSAIVKDTKTFIPIFQWQIIIIFESLGTNLKTEPNGNGCTAGGIFSFHHFSSNFSPANCRLLT